MRNKDKHKEACFEGMCFSFFGLMLVRLGVKKMEEQFENQKEEDYNDYTKVTLLGQMIKKQILYIRKYDDLLTS